MSDNDEYGSIPDEDLIEALSQPSQQLPPLFSPPRPNKRRRISAAPDNDDVPNGRPRRSREGSESCKSGDDSEEEDGKAKKKKYRIHIGDKGVPAKRIIGATQAEALPDSSPYRIRGPIYKKPRPEPVAPPIFSQPKKRTPTPKSIILQNRSRNSQEYDFNLDLDGIPSDAFSSPEKDTRPTEPIVIGSSPPQQTQANSRPQQRLMAPQQGLRQTTLFGGRAAEEVPASQVNKVHNFIVDRPPELPTHHVLNQEALKTWVYPTNLGDIREYQYSIVKHGLFNNLLVALPTGLGKTFIAATIMYNFFRWTKDSQIVFVAPTKPLVAQQVDACFNIVGIPRSQTTMLTGEQNTALRAEEWEARRVFFMTPQTLINDLSSGIADPKKIVLLVVDEAHRATGNYAYVKVVSFLRRFNKSFRVLALTATPGASVEAVQEVIDGLEISKVEIRTEESIDIQRFVHRRDIDQIILDPSDEIIEIKGLLAKALQPLLNILRGQNGYWSGDPMAITTFGMMQARKNWFSSEAGRKANQGLKGMMNAIFALLASVSHGIKLLNFHGIGPFFSIMKDFRSGNDDARKPSKYKTQILENADFRKMMDMVQVWVNKEDFVGHPKMTYLCDTVLKHFLYAGEGGLGQDAPPSSTRVIVFSEFRDSAEEIARVLNRHGPMVRASVFVGQADSKRSEGMNQAMQQETITKFKTGKFNVLVATSIGEEGLDIGQVDLIVCYDASGSPIRMLQRMGRTGRKRAGNIVLLLMRGKEEEAFAKAKDNYESMQKMISSGARFNLRNDLSVRIIPREIVPVVEKRIIEIPPENTQDTSIPIPQRRATKGKKKPAKKFHMPDGVTTGFQKASGLAGSGSILKALGAKVKRKKSPDDLVPILPVESVYLNSDDERELEERFQQIDGDEIQEVEPPDLTAHPAAQRSLGPAIYVSHGHYTKRCVALFKTLGDSQRPEDRHEDPCSDEPPSQQHWDYPELVDERDIPKPSKSPRSPKAPSRVKRPTPAKPKRPPEPVFVFSDSETETENIGMVSTARMEKQGPSSQPEPDSEGEGDDLMHSEEVSEDDESDAGSLNEFLDDGTQHQPSSSKDFGLSRSSTTPPATEMTEKSFSESTQITPVPNSADLDDDDDDELPRLSQLMSSMNKKSTFDDEEDEPLAPKGRTKRKIAVEDSDSDE